MKKLSQLKKGFTIIEVTLVLAIAGLIFMMVFIALPGLQRSQRDTQRANDIGRVITAIANYQTANNGALPNGTGTVVASIDDDTGTTKIDPAATTSKRDWSYFYQYYIIATGDKFSDPNGDPYSLIVLDCTAKADDNPECSKGQRAEVNFEDQADGSLAEGEDKAPFAISILKHATCEGDSAVYNSGARRVAVLYKNEGGGAVCRNN